MRKKIKTLVLLSAASFYPSRLYSGPNVVRVFSARCKTVAYLKCKKVFLGTAVKNMESSNYTRKKSMAFEASSATLD